MLKPTIKHKAEIDSIVSMHRELIATFYMRLVLGYEDKKESRLYIDLNSLEMFFITRPISSKNANSANSVNSVNNPSMYELAYNNGEGVDLPEEEKEYFKNHDFPMYGLSYYLECHLMPRIDDALEQRTKRIK